MQVVLDVYVKQDSPTGYFTHKTVKVELTDEVIMQIGDRYLKLSKEKDNEQRDNRIKEQRICNA